MSLLTLLTLAAAASAGAAMGSFLLLTLINKPVLDKGLAPRQLHRVVGRFYRLNTVLCLIAGLLAALVGNRPAALVLAILAVSYVFSHMHVLRGIESHVNASPDPGQQRALASLYLLQNIVHFAQFVGTGYGIYLLV